MHLLQIILPIGYGRNVCDITGTIIHQQQYDLALTYSLESLELAQKVHHRYRISSVSQNLGIIYRLLAQLEQAQYYLDESLRLAQEIQNLWLIAETRGEYGWLYLAQKRSSEAKEMFDCMHLACARVLARLVVSRRAHARCTDSNKLRRTCQHLLWLPPKLLESVTPGDVPTRFTRKDRDPLLI